MRNRVLDYAVAMAALVVAVLLRWLLDPLMGDTLPLVTLFGAVAAAVWVGGYRPAVLVAILGYLACGYLFIPPRGDLTLTDRVHMVGLVAYLFTCTFIIGIGQALRTAQLQASQRGELLRVTLASIGDAVITTDLEARVTSLNAAAESLSGWTRREALGQPLEAVFQVVNEQTRRPVESPATRALRDGLVVGLANHSLLIRKDGGERPIDDSAAPIRDDDGNVSGCVLIFRDVTVQRRLEQGTARQLQTARLLSSIVESSNDAIISKSLDGVIQTWNAAAERLFGHSAQQAVGRHVSLIIPPDRLAEEGEILARLEAGQRIEHFETERLTSDGRRISVSLSISPIRDEAGAVVGAAKIARDVTEHKQMEDNLRRLAKDLSEAARRKDEFLAMLAHELRNPLAPLSNAVQILRLAGGDGAKVQAASEMLERQVRQMTRLVDDLLDMSRITQGRIALRKERVELAPILEQAVEAVRALYKSLDHQLTVAIPDAPVYVSADPTRLAQVVGNLLQNAAKFTDPGGQVWLTAERAGPQVAIRVRDNGIGIGAEQRPRLFEMFMQVDRSLERSRDGLGIGLTLVKTLVEMHGGTVEAHSAGLGQGSEFVVLLPALEEERRPPAEPPASEPAPPSSRRVLIVDDNQDSAESLALLLKLGGHETHTAHDGLQAIEAAERLRPDAVLLDIGLPQLNGYDVCRRLRQEPWGKGLLLVAVTGWGQDIDRHRSREAGFDTHIVKPVDPDKIMRLLSSPASSRTAG